jgi:hypothetical protein
MSRVLAGAEPAAGSDQVVDRALHRADRAAQALKLGIDILRDDLADHQFRHMQHGRADRQPFIEPNTIEPHGNSAPLLLWAISTGLTNSPLAISSATIIAIV